MFLSVSVQANIYILLYRKVPAVEKRLLDWNICDNPNSVKSDCNPALISSTVPWIYFSTATHHLNRVIETALFFSFQPLNISTRLMQGIGRGFDY
jgi:hypothetical protein